MIDILLPILQNKLQVWAAQTPTALCTKSQAVQALLAPYSALTGTQIIANKGLNIPEQDIPNTSLEPNNISPLIAELSSQANSKAIKQLELRVLQ